MAGIAREVLPASGKRALNKFLTEYDWDEQQFNHERLEELQKHGETRWSKDGYIILDDTITEKAGDEVPGVGHFYDHAEGDTVWGQDLIYAFYADDKTAYPLTLRLYEQQDEDDDNPVKYLATNKVDAPTEHVVRSYGMRWRIETFFESSKQDLGLGDCEMQTDEGTSRHWHLLMAAYSLVRLDPDSSALETVRSKASSLRSNLEHSLKEAVYHLLSCGFETTMTEASMISWKKSTLYSFTQLLTLMCKAEYNNLNFRPPSRFWCRIRLKN